MKKKLIATILFLCSTSQKQNKRHNIYLLKKEREMK